MGASVYVGLAAASHNAQTAHNRRSNNLRITAGSTNNPPVATLTSPTSGSSFTAPATISMTATASDPENQLARVDSSAGNTVVGSDTSAPFAWTWSNVAAGTYSLTAKAYDSAGAVATSAAVTVTVGTTPPRSTWSLRRPPTTRPT